MESDASGAVEKTISVSGLMKSYGELAAVNGVSFDVFREEVFSLLGPNGAGKTTTVEILEGLRRADAGVVSVLGLDPWKKGKELHSRTGVIPQGFRFFDKATPKEAVEYSSIMEDCLVEKWMLSVFYKRLSYPMRVTPTLKTFRVAKNRRLGWP